MGYSAMVHHWHGFDWTSRHRLNSQQQSFSLSCTIAHSLPQYHIGTWTTKSLEYKVPTTTSCQPRSPTDLQEREICMACERERERSTFLIENNKKYDVDEQYLARWGEILFIANFCWPRCWGWCAGVLVRG